MSDDEPQAHGHPGPGLPHGHGPGPGWSREEALAVLESPERRRLLDPEAVWNEVGLPTGSVVADVGAGTGYFAVPAARIVGRTGKVFAIELSAPLIELLSDRRREERLEWLVPVRSREDTIPLPSGVANVVLMATVLHDVPASTVSEAVRLLHADGRFVNIDWSKEPSPWGPPIEIRLTPSEALARFAPLGLELVKSWIPGPHHYAQVLRRKGPSGSVVSR